MKLEKAYQIIGMTEEEFRYLDTTQILESPDSPTGYVVSFRYKSSEYKKLSVIGDWMFSDKEHSSFTDSGRYWPHQWKKMMRQTFFHVRFHCHQEHTTIDL